MSGVEHPNVPADAEDQHAIGRLLPDRRGLCPPARIEQGGFNLVRSSAVPRLCGRWPEAGFVDRWLSGLIEWLLRRFTDLEVRDYEHLLHLSGLDTRQRGAAGHSTNPRKPGMTHCWCRENANVRRALAGPRERRA